MLNPDTQLDLGSFSIPPWVKLFGALLVIAAIVIAIYSYGQQQFDIGKKAERADWLKRDNAALVKANARIDQLNREKAALEAASEQRLADKTTAYLKERQHEKAKSDAVIADLRTGNAGLFYHLANHQGAGGGGSRQVGAAASGGDGGTDAQLPAATGADIYAEADRADSIVRQLGLCQQVVIEDRRICGKQTNQEK